MKIMDYNFGNDIFIDAHCHLTDLRWGNPGKSPWPSIALTNAINEASDLGIQFYMQGGVSPDEWELQEKLKSIYPDQIGLCFGIHPYFVAKSTDEECEHALDQLALKIGKGLALGESGLDFRPTIMGSSQDRQFDLLQAQMELAEASNKPMVFHVVQAHEEFLKILDIWGVPRAGGMVHSFNGSVKKAEDLISRGLYLSVGGPLTYKTNQKLKQAVKEIPLDRLLLETDSPDQGSEEYKNQLNPIKSLFHVAEVVAEIKKISTKEVLKINTENFKRFISKG